MKKLNNLFVLFFVVLFVGSSLTFAQPYRKMQRGDNNCWLEQNLNLTDQQQEALSNLRYDHQMKASELRAKIQQNRLTIQKMFDDDEINRDAAMKLVDENNSLRGELRKMRVDMRIETNSLLTDEQKAELKDRPGFRNGRCFNDGRGNRHDRSYGKRGKHFRNNAW